MPSKIAVFTQLTLSRIFHGDRGVDTFNPAFRRIAWSVNPTPAVFLAAPVGSGQTSLRRSRENLWFISSAMSQVVALTMMSSSKMWSSSSTRTAEDGGHVVDVEVEADPEGELGDVGDWSLEMFSSVEVEGDEAGEVLETGLEFLAEGAGV